MHSNGTARLKRTFVLLAAATLLIFGGIVYVQVVRLRQPLHEEVLRREAESIHAVAQMQIGAAQTRLAKLNVELLPDDVFAAVLESSRLNGVLAVQLFDPNGRLRESLPAVAPGGREQSAWWHNPLPAALAQLRVNGSLEEIFGIAPEPGTEPTRVTLLEVVVPLTTRGGTEYLGTARYRMTGDETAAELAHLDRSLFTQATIALVAGAGLVGLLLGWAYQQLSDAQRRLVAQSTDLTRANEELDFAAKTAALGAISAHLIHGLKNPLAGLEGFVAETSTTDPSGPDAAARETALDAARRVRHLINEVVTVLRDEGSSEATYMVPVKELMQAVEARALPLAANAGITLEFKAADNAQVSSRTASLAGLVLANLLTNAIEASPRGGLVQVGSHATNGQVEFHIVDRGAGLPEDVKASTFRPVRSSKPGGGGIGLAISHRLARHAGGDLGILRSDAGGTTFRLIVPASA